MSLGTVLLIIVILALVGIFPREGSYNANWGYYPFGGGGLILLILVILLLMGRIRF